MFLVLRLQLSHVCGSRFYIKFVLISYFYQFRFSTLIVQYISHHTAHEPSHGLPVFRGSTINKYRKVWSVKNFLHIHIKHLYWWPIVNLHVYVRPNSSIRHWCYRQNASKVLTPANVFIRSTHVARNWWKIYEGFSEPCIRDDSVVCLALNPETFVVRSCFRRSDYYRILLLPQQGLTCST